MFCTGSIIPLFILCHIYHVFVVQSKPTIAYMYMQYHNSCCWSEHNFVNPPQSAPKDILCKLWTEQFCLHLLDFFIFAKSRMHLQCFLKCMNVIHVLIFFFFARFTLGLCILFSLEKLWYWKCIYMFCKFKLLMRISFRVLPYFSKIR